MKHVACLSLFMLFPSLALAQKQGYVPPSAAGFPLAPGLAIPPPPPPPDDYPPPAYRESPPPPDSLTGLTLAAGIAFGKPWGDVGKSSSSLEPRSMGTAFSAQIPLSIAAAYRPIPMFSFGVTAQYAPVTSNDCGAGNSCSASNTRIGGELRVHIVPEQILSPWLSVGAGYEWLGSSFDGGGESLDQTFSGWDFDLQIGGDFRTTHFLTVGPFIGLRVGSFGHTRASGTFLSAPVDQAIPDSQQATHGWWTFGVRGTFTFFASAAQ